MPDDRNPVLKQVRDAYRGMLIDPPNQLTWANAVAALKDAGDRIEGLLAQAVVADEQLAQLRGFAEAHKTCIARDELPYACGDEHPKVYYSATRCPVCVALRMLKQMTGIQPTFNE